MFATTNDTFSWIPKSQKTSKHTVICECKGIEDGYLYQQKHDGFGWTQDSKAKVVQPLRKLIDGYIVKHCVSDGKTGTLHILGHGNIQLEVEYDFISECIIKLGLKRWYSVEPSKKTIKYTADDGNTVYFMAVQLFLTHAIDNFDVDIDHILRHIPDTIDISYSLYV